MTFIVVMIASMAAVGLYSGQSSTRNTGAETDEVPEPEETPSGIQTFPDGPAPVLDASKAYVATLETSKGAIKIDLLSDAPKAINSFAFLAGSGFYNGTALFYVNQKYFAQGGDPTCSIDRETVCTGAAGPGYTLEVENTDAAHEAWSVVAPYVVQGQSVHGSQFRILFGDDTRLDGTETVFGKVSDPASQEILRSLGNFEPCSVVSSETCSATADMSAALVIEKVTVAPANA